MKIYMAGTAINLRGHKEQSLQNYLQLRYDSWLGKDTVRVEVSKLDHKLIELKVYRTYGDWYENPQWHSNSKGSIFQLDEWIIMGEEYQTGTYADLTQLNGRYIIRDDICIGLKKVDSERKSTCLNIESKKGTSIMDWSPTCISKKVHPSQLFQRKFPRRVPLFGDGFVPLQKKTA